MNESLYRIVFNKARGCMMAVSELASSHSSGKDKHHSAAARSFGRSHSQFHSTNQSGTVFDDSFGKPKPVVKAINVVVLFSMLLSSLSAPLSAYAQIRSDANAPGNQRPTILNTANGLPQVNIQTPSAAGVSRNQYSQFDVDGRGVVINNSRTNTNTQLGGMVQGNPWLAQGSARIIVNEVNSSNPSYLNGYIEVAGQRAEIIIANPSGISVNGGGFINASSATLTTGSPIINGGNLEGYAVQKGTVTIDGYGLDASLTDYTGILARSVQVNAGIWANNLNIVTGANQISADQSSSSPIAGVGGAPSFSLDVSNLGGMYAGKISLVGTEAGLGVRNAGYVGASAGDVSITSDGMLINSGIINSGANTNIATKGSVNNSGSINATGDANIDSQAEMVNTGSVLAAGNINIQTPGAINNSGYVYASGNTSLKAGGDIHNSGLVAAQGNTSVTTTAANGSINNTNTSVLTAGMTPDGKLLTTGNLSLDADGLVTAKGLMIAGNQLSISSSSLDVSGTSLSAGALALTAKRGDLDATGASLSVLGDMDLNAAQSLKTDSAILTAGNVSLSANTWSHIKGQVLQAGTADTPIAVTGKIDNTEGVIASNGLNMNINAGAIDNRKGSVLHAGYGALDITSGPLKLTDGQIASNGNLNLSVSNIDGEKGILLSKNDMHVIAGEVFLSGGQMSSGKSLHINALSINSDNGQITSNEKLALHTHGALVNSNGLIASNSDVNLQTGSISNLDGIIVADNVTINTNGQALTNVAGKIASNGELNINSGELNNDNGSLQSAGNMSINTKEERLINTAGNTDANKGILSQGTLNINTGNLDNTAGYIAALGKTNLSVSSLNNDATGVGVSTVKGTILSNDELTITTTVGSLSNAGSQIQSAKKLVLNINEDLNNTQGLIVSSGEVDITAKNIINTNTKKNSIVDKLDPITQQAILDSNGNVVKETKLVINGIQGKSVKIAAELVDNQNGGILSSEALTINSNGALLNNQGMIAAGDVANVTVNNLSNVQGTLQATQKLTIDTVQGLLDNTGGLITSSSDVEIHANNTINRGTKIETWVNKLDADGYPIFDDFTNTWEQEVKYSLQGIQGKNVSISTNNFDNTEGGLLANEALIVSSTGEIDNTRGMITSHNSIDITATKVINYDGVIQSTDALTLYLNNGTLDNTYGYVASNGDITISAKTVINKRPNTGDGDFIPYRLDESGELAIDANGNPIKYTSKNGGIRGKTVNINSSFIDNRQSLIVASDDLRILSDGEINNTKGRILSSGNTVIKDAVAFDDLEVQSTTPVTDTNNSSKTLSIENSFGSISANKSLIIDAKSLTGDGIVINNGISIDVMQDTSFTQVKKNAEGKWVYVVDGVICSLDCTQVPDSDVSVRKITYAGDLVKKNANGEYIRVDNTGTPVLEDGYVIVEDSGQVINALEEIIEGNITIKLIDNFNQQQSGYTLANGNLDLRTKGNIYNDGHIQARQALNLQAIHIENDYFGEISAGATQLAANTITNRGLVDGSFTLLQANEINNIGTGRIYGDQVSILAGGLNNKAETLGATKWSAVIAARDRLDIGASVITNQDGSLLLSMGDMAVGNNLDSNGHATGKANAFLNNSATVDVQGKLDINAGLFMNKDLYGTSINGTSVDKQIVYIKTDIADPAGNSIFFTGGTWDDHTGAARNCDATTCPTDEQWSALYATPQTNGDATNATYVSTAGTWRKNDGTYVLTTNEGDVFNNPIWRLDFVTKTTNYSNEIAVDPAKIYVGGEMNLNADNAVNDKSKIIVGGALNVSGDNLQNIGESGSSVTTQRNESWDTKVIGGVRKLTNFEAADWTPISDYWSSPAEVRYNTMPVGTGVSIDSFLNLELNGGGQKLEVPLIQFTVQNQSGIATNVGSTEVGAGTNIGSVATPSDINRVVRTNNGNAAQTPDQQPLPDSANNSPKGYLVETDPRFTQSKLWLGSDYMLKQMGYDPATQTQRLGDGFYEQKLIREQVAELTGRRFLNDYSNDEEQYKALMTAGALFAKQYKLDPRRGSHRQSKWPC
jgi:filamentous hemagglutinin